MKLFIPLVSLLSMVLAEPPVGEGYPAARPHNHDHSDVASRSQDYSSRTLESSRNTITEYTPNERNRLSNEYDVPNTRSSSVYSEYSVPNARSSSISTEYGAPNARSSSISSGYALPSASSRQKYAPPAARVSFSQTYGASKNRGLAKSTSQEYQSPNGRNAPSQNYRNSITRSGLSQEYGAPNSRSGLSLEYGVPNTRSGISEEYGTPAQRSLSQEYGAPELSSRTLSTEYGVPDARSTPSEEYGAPAIARSSIKPGSKSTGSSFKSSFRGFQTQGQNAQISSNDYAIHSARPNELPQSFGPKPSRNVFGPRSSSSAHSGSLPFSYSPSAKDFNSYSQDYKSPSESYGVPAMDLSVAYGAPSERSLSQEYGVPSSASLKTKAIASSYSTASHSSNSRSPTPFVPSVRGVSEQYGLPEQYDALSNQGYNYAAGTLDESDQEPPNYDFAYKVSDYASGSDFGHTESRQENHAEGSYFVVLPDGTKQIVEYEADEGGFKPRISVEPAQNDGYDGNASHLGRSEGPY